MRVAVFVHATWSTWDRLPLLVGEVERQVHRAIGAKCAELGVDLVALGGIEDHVHLLIRLPASIALAEVIGQVKGASAHLVTPASTPGEFFKWQGGYGAFSVSARNLQHACDCINHQREHHRTGKTYPALEPRIPTAFTKAPMKTTPSSPRRRASWLAAASPQPQASACGATPSAACGTSHPPERAP